MAEFKVRAARPGDVDAVRALERRCKDAPHWTVKVYQQIVVAEPRALVERLLLVAEAPEGVVGFAVASCLQGEAELESVVVDAALRRRGMARALCGAVREWALARGAEAVVLEVRSANSGARRLYGGLGFVEAGRRARYYSDPADDAVLMRWALGETARVEHL